MRATSKSIPSFEIWPSNVNPQILLMTVTSPIQPSRKCTQFMHVSAQCASLYCILDSCMLCNGFYRTSSPQVLT